MLKELYWFKEDKKAFGKKLNDFRKMNEFTIDELALGLGEGYEESLKKWLLGDRLPDLDTVKDLSDILKISMEELLLPESILKINDNKYSNVYLSSDDNKLDLFRKIYPIHKDDISEWINNLTIEELQMQADFKEEINYLIQKKFLSFLTESEEDKLKFYFKNVLIVDNDAEDIYEFQNCDYDSFWKNIESELIKRKGLAYKYRMNKKEALEELYELKKKISFAPVFLNEFKFPQVGFIDEIINSINDAKLLNAYLNQFDKETLNCLLTCSTTNKRTKKVLEELGAKIINYNFSNKDCSSSIQSELQDLSYEDYMKAIGGTE